MQNKNIKKKQKTEYKIQIIIIAVTDKFYPAISEKIQKLFPYS